MKCMSGGLDKTSKVWEHLGYISFTILHNKWQWHLLKMLKQKLPKAKLENIVGDMYKKYQNGFVANVQKGEVPSRYHSLAKYIAKYVASPQISLRRIDEYDGREATYHYRSHVTEREEQEKVGVFTFIGRMIQHVFPKGFQRVRYYGMQATKSYAKNKKIIHEALLKVKGVIKRSNKNNQEEELSRKVPREYR